jgi:hypothetical protein
MHYLCLWKHLIVKEKNFVIYIIPKKSIKVIPSSVPGKGGKIGASVTQHLIKNYITKDNTREEDPREAILKYAKEAEEKPYFMAVYKKTQPITPFDYSEEKDDLNSEKKD